MAEINAECKGKRRADGRHKKKVGEDQTLTIHERHILAFGVIGLLPHEFYNLLLDEWLSLAEGYRRKKYEVSFELRHATYLSLLPVVKDLSYETMRQLWPLEFDEKQEKKTEPNMIDMATWEALKKQMTLPEEKTEYEMIMDKHKTLNIHG